jgi:hypothetical protein
MRDGMGRDYLARFAPPLRSPDLRTADFSGLKRKDATSFCGRDRAPNPAQPSGFRFSGAAQESNLPTDGYIGLPGLKIERVWLTEAV